MSERLRLAYFTPLPPQRSGIADYSAALLPYLAEHVAAGVFVDAPEQVEPLYRQQFSVHPIAEFLTRPAMRFQYDACLYHMGNQPLYHEQVYQALLRCPGIVVLHEVGLLGFYLNRPEPGGGPASFIREMGYAYGTPGTQAARAILYDRRADEACAYPLFNRIAAVSQGIIVHTRTARAQILREVPRTQVTCSPLAAHVPPSAALVSKPDWLACLPPGAVVLASFGYIAPSKRVEIVLRAVARLRNDYPQLCYVLVGEPVDNYDLTPFIRQLGLENTVHVTGFVDNATFGAYLQAIDIGVNLRTGPGGGEMSAAVVQLLAAGRPTIVSDIGGFAELPPDCVIKIEQDEREVDRLFEALRKLLANPSLRETYGAAARRYVQQEWSFASVAECYVQFIQNCLARAD